MVIAQPSWFKRRKYLGWGAYPASWQGWLYIIIAIIPIAIIQAIPNLSQETRLIALGIWAILLFIDIMDVMIRMKRDEREKVHEAIAERNALWAVMIVLAIGIAYEAATSAVKGIFTVDPFIIAALVAALIVKSISNIYLDRKD